MRPSALIFVLLTLTSPAHAQGFTQLPTGQMVFTPQPRDFPTPQYYSPQGGPPIGYGVKSGDQQLFIPYNGNNPPPQGWTDE